MTFSESVPMVREIYINIELKEDGALLSGMVQLHVKQKSTMVHNPQRLQVCVCAVGCIMSLNCCTQFLLFEVSDIHTNCDSA